MKDLIVLVADKNMDFGLRGILGRPEALCISPFSFDIYVHVRRDPGCRRESQDFLRPFLKEYRYSIVLFDHHGSGAESTSPKILANEVRGRLRSNGWDTRTEVIVLDPELEIWVFSPSPQVERCLGWGKSGIVRQWLEREGLWDSNEPKPQDPREALQRVLGYLRRPRSSDIYYCLGKRVNFQHCSDLAFLKLQTILRNWFPQIPPDDSQRM